MARPRKQSNTETPQKPQSLPQPTEPQGVHDDDTTAARPERERIERRAYELYLARGGSDGDPMEDWLAAEREFNVRAGKRERNPSSE